MLFERNVMPFGVWNAPQIFSELMSILLEGLHSLALAYLDGILIFLKTIEEHKKHIKTPSTWIKLKSEKCSFLKKKTQYLEFVIDIRWNTTRPVRGGCDTILTYPTSVREVRSLIGMCSYYRRLIRTSP